MNLFILSVKILFDLFDAYIINSTFLFPLGVLIVDEQPEVTGSAQGRFLGLDLVEPMYIGSVPDFANIETNVGATKGFIGEFYLTLDSCINN